MKAKVFLKMAAPSLFLALSANAEPVLLSQFEVNRSFVASDSSAVENLDLPAEISFHNLEITRANIFEGPQVKAQYTISGKIFDVQTDLIRKSTQEDGTFLVSAALFEKGIEGASCGPHSMSRATLDFVLSADALSAQDFSFSVVHEATEDNCHLPMQTQLFPYTANN